MIAKTERTGTKYGIFYAPKGVYLEVDDEANTGIFGFETFTFHLQNRSFVVPSYQRPIAREEIEKEIHIIVRESGGIEAIPFYYSPGEKLQIKSGGDIVFSILVPPIAQEGEPDPIILTYTEYTE